MRRLATRFSRPEAAPHATTVGIDLETDLAVTKVDERNLATLPFRKCDDLRASQLVLSIGSPLGLDNSVSLGVVSAVARHRDSGPMCVQADAAINPASAVGRRSICAAESSGSTH